MESKTMNLNSIITVFDSNELSPLWTLTFHFILKDCEGDNSKL